jgi:hypothetical protein
MVVRVLILLMGLAALAPAPARAAATEAPPAPQPLAVVTEGWLPGFDKAELGPFIAREMNAAGLAQWRFAPEATEAQPAPDRVEWVFKPNPYAGGPTLPRTGMVREIDKLFGVHRYISVEVRLYLHGEYQLLESDQPRLQGGPRDTDLQKEIVKLTRTLASANAPGTAPKP